MVTPTVFDLGMNDGTDTEFYLSKGFDVVAVEASAPLCRQVAARRSRETSTGRLVIENVAVSAAPGRVNFFPNAKSEWGTTRPDWVTRNAKLNHPALAPIEVEAVTVADLVKRHGMPYYVKIDVEGADLVALEGLAELGERPSYVSLESDKVSWSALEREFDVLEELGYVRFKVVAQQWVPLQRAPRPAREGRHVPWRFKLGSSGLFGEEAPGPWLPRDEAVRQYRKIFRRYRLFGDTGTLVPPGLAGAAVRRYLAGWYDTHAGR